MIANQDAVKAYIIKHEGCQLKLYYCTAGKASIGIGRNLDDRGISQDEAEHMFVNDLNLSLSDLIRVFPDFTSYHPDAQMVLIDMMFQLGISKFKGFVKMIDHIKHKNWKGAADEILDSIYATQVPSRAKDNAELLRQI